MKIFWEKNKNIIAYLTGLLVVFFSLIPYFVLGENIWVPFHDQLDGEVLNYIYQAKYLFKGDVVWELMNGISKTGMLPPAPLAVLFFKLCSPFVAYTLLQILVSFVAYTGMFLLLLKGTGNGLTAFMAAGLFAYLPMMPVYGLSIAGQPLLWYAFWNLYEKKKPILWWSVIILYAGFSSFALCGFGVCLVVAIGMVVLIFWNKQRKENVGWYGSGFLILCLAFFSCNIGLFSEFFHFTNNSTGNFLSHRTEMVQSGVGKFWGEFKITFFGEGTYTPAFGEIIFILTIILVCLFVAKKILRRDEAICEKKTLTAVLLMLGVIFTLSFLSVAWNSELCLNTIRRFGPLEYFQADRISWMIPPLWYVLLGIDLKLIFEWGKPWRLATLLIVMCVGIGIYENSFFYHHIRQLVFPDTYQLMTWKQYYAEDIMVEIEEYILNDTGKDKQEYRVVSLGMSPATALYHGFYCLDGYSNNYSLEYKHAFRKTMEKELEKSEANRVYFDEWGNRCYFMSSESGGTPLINKHQATAYHNLEINCEALRKMGCEYIFSAMEIEDAEENSLELEGIFETPSSYYKVYLYRINLQSKNGANITKG